MTIDAGDIRPMFAEQPRETRLDRVMTALEKATWALLLASIAVVYIIIAID